MEICEKCGKAIKMSAFKRPNHLFQGKFYCKECYEEVSKKFYEED